MKKILVMSLILAMSLVGDVKWACAQEMDTEEFTLEEITVTAQKREENLQKVPIAMEVVSGDEIKELGFTNLDQITSSMASVFINTQQDGMRVTIRGMSDDAIPSGTSGSISNSSAMVAVNTDGVYTSGKGGVGLYDVERVEVLYGPQSTLYSSTSPGGIVNIVTGNPKIGEYDMSGTFKFGNYHTVEMQGVLNAPVNDTTALRIAYNSAVRDGYLADGSDDEDRRAARLKVLFKPNDKFSLTAAGEYTKLNQLGYNGRAAFVTQDDLDDPWDNSGTTGPAARRFGTDTPKIYGRMDWDTGIGELSFIPMYSTQKKENKGVTGTNRGFSYTETIKAIRREKGAELRLVSSADSIYKWVLGSNYYKVYQYQDYRQYFDELGYHISKNRGNNQETKAVYGNITYPVKDNFRLTAGTRWSSDQSEAIQWAQELTGPTGGPIDILLVAHDNLSDYSGVDYKIGTEYDLSPTSMLYADVSSSYRSVPALTEKSFDPEKLMAYQVGYKSQFFEKKLQVNASAYYYEYDNYVLSAGRIMDPYTGQADSGVDTSGAMVKKGIDLQISSILGNAGKLDFSVSYLDSEFKDTKFDFVSEYLTDLDISGDPETFSSKWSLTLSYTKSFNLPNGGTLAARIDSRYKTGYYISYANWQQDTTVWPYPIIELGEGTNYQEAYHMSNFALIYTHPDGKWSLTGYANNLENYAEKKNLMMDSIMIGAPRTFGAVISVKY